MKASKYPKHGEAGVSFDHNDTYFLVHILFFYCITYYSRIKKQVFTSGSMNSNAMLVVAVGEMFSLELVVFFFFAL